MTQQVELPRSDRPRVSIIVPSVSPERLRVALASLAADASASVPFETIVVANGAGPEVAQALDAVASGVELVVSPVSRGVAGGYNLGRASARGELIVLLHDDVVVEPGWFQAWIDATDAYPTAGVVGSKVLFPDGSLRGAGNVLWSDGTTSPPWSGEPPPPETFDTPRLVDYTPSCSLLVRAVTWDSVGGLDEELFPKYYVDVDLAMSTRRLGWGVLYWPASVVRHSDHPASGRRRRAFVAARNRELFIRRWANELADQPPPGTDIAHAIESASRRSETSPRHQRPTRAEDARPERDYVAMAHELDAAYRDHLEGQLDAAERKVAELEQGRSDICTLGSAVEFRAGGNAGRWATSGGHDAEEWGRWIGDVPFVIELPIAPLGADIVPPRPELLEIELVHYVCGARPRSRCTVELDGVHVLDIEEMQAGAVRYSAVIPPPAPGTTRRRHVTVVIRAHQPISPAAAGESADPRPLGTGLVSLTLT